ncbi:hypothetical protein GLA29479_2752 [Lysobacter antibioticus]|nr:hypothetical protein GLA29479_2752 [Lysobacter antibioticus]
MRRTAAPRHRIAGKPDERRADAPSLHHGAPHNLPMAHAGAPDTG